MADGKGYSPSPFINDFSQMFSMKGKRRRTMISAIELEQLENYFLQDMWPSRKKKELLAQQMCKSERFVDIWFQNRRARMRRLSKEKDTHHDDSLSIPIIRLHSNAGVNVGLLDLGADQAAIKMNEVRPIFKADDVRPTFRADDVRPGSSDQIGGVPDVTVAQTTTNKEGVSNAGCENRKSDQTNPSRSTSTTVGLVQRQGGLLVSTKVGLTLQMNRFSFSF